MKLEIKTIVDCSEELKKLSDVTTLPAPIAFELGLSLHEVDKLLKTYDKSRLKLYQKYGKLTEDGKNYVVEPEFGEQLVSEMEQLNAAEVDLDLNKIKIGLLKDEKLPVSFYAKMNWLLEK